MHLVPKVWPLTTTVCQRPPAYWIRIWERRWLRGKQTTSADTGLFTQLAAEDGSLCSSSWWPQVIHTYNPALQALNLLYATAEGRRQEGRTRAVEQIGATGQNEWDPKCQHESLTMRKTTQLGATLRLISECIMQMMLGFFYFFLNACFNLGCCCGIQISNLAVMKRGKSGKKVRERWRREKKIVTWHLQSNWVGFK